MEETVDIRGEVVLLQALLKMVRAIESGGEVREYLAEYDVEVNGERETRRGRQLRDGDEVRLPDGRTLRIRAERA